MESLEFAVGPLAGVTDGFSPQAISREEVSRLPALVFILWAVKTYNWNLRDFKQHFGSSFPVERYVEVLKYHDFIGRVNHELTLKKSGADLLERVLGGQEVAPELAVLESDTRDTPNRTGVYNASWENGDAEAWPPSLSSPHASPRWERNGWDTQHLPQAPDPFVGRVDELNWILEKVASGQPTMCAITGMSGIGKTSLAGVVVHHLMSLDLFVDGIAYVRCGQLTPYDVVLQLCLQLDAASFTADLDEVSYGALSSLATNHLRGKDLFVILDNIVPDFSLDEVLPILRDAGVSALFISQHKLTSPVLDRENMRLLTPLSESGALFLFTYEIQRTDQKPLQEFERIAALTIVHEVECHPLAVKLLGVYAASNREQLPNIALQLQQRQSHMFEMSGDAKDLQARFTLSIDRLPDEAERLFTALAAFAEREFSYNAVHALAKTININDPIVWIETLIHRTLLIPSTEAWLPESSDTRRLRIHNLLFSVAQQRFSAWSEEDRWVAYQAIATYYCQYSSRLLGTLQRPEAESALDRDKEVIQGAIEWALAGNYDTILLTLCSAMRGAWYHHWRIPECTRYLPSAIEAGNRLIQKTTSAEIVTMLVDVEFTYAQFLSRLGKLRDASDVLQSNLARRKRMNDKRGQAAVTAEMGRIDLSHGNLRTAERRVQESLQNRRAQHDRHGMAHDLSLLGTIKMWQGIPARAYKYLHESLSIAREIGDLRIQARALMLLGQLARQRADLSEAEARLQEGYEILVANQDKLGQAVALHQLGLVACTRGALYQAIQYFLASLALRHEGNDRRGEGESLGYLARVARIQGRYGEAEHYLRESLAAARETQDLRGEANVVAQQGRLALEQRNLQAAEAFLTKSIELHLEAQDRRGLGVAYGFLGRVRLAQNELNEARGFLNASLRSSRIVKDPQGQAFVLFAKAELAARSGEINQALSLMRAAQKIAKDSRLIVDEVRFLLEEARIYAEHTPEIAQALNLTQSVRYQLEQNEIQRDDLLRKTAEVEELISSTSH